MSGGKTPKNATLTETTETKSGGYQGKTGTKTMEGWLSKFMDDDDDIGSKKEPEEEVQGTIQYFVYINNTLLLGPAV